jgi:ABC-type Fe3+/spermidine/putrescine transport system ATPase subunit
MSAATQPAIAVDVDGVSKRFSHRVKGEIYAARNVRFTAAAGAFVTLLGPSGCGKTTTLRMIAGFEQPDEGRIRFGRDDVTDLPVNERNIGFVFQNYALFPHLSVFENVAYGLQVRGQPTRGVASSVGDVLGLVGLTGYEHQFPAQLSGGEQQRVALARAIVIRPRVLLFDEPLSNLDAKLRVQMRGDIRELQRRLAITTIYVTHDQEEAMAVSDHIVVMNQGSIVQEGTAEDLYHRPASEFVATFVGRVNLISGKVIARNDGIASVAALGGIFKARVGAAALDVGQRTQLVLRPEAIAIAPGGEGLPARVMTRTFLGEKVEYGLQCAETSLQAIRHSSGADDAIHVGDQVALRFGDDTLVALPQADR